MNVIPVTNSQPAFNGYIGKDVLKVIHKSTKNAIKYEINTANKQGNLIEETKLDKVIKLRDQVLKKLRTHLAKFHKDTYLTLDGDQNYFVLRNKTLGTEIETPWLLNLKALSESTLLRINIFADRLITYMPSKQADTEIFEAFTKKLSDLSSISSPFRRFISRKRAKKADILAPEFRQEGGWQKKLEMLIADYETIQQNKITNKEIAKKYR